MAVGHYMVAIRMVVVVDRMALTFLPLHAPFSERIWLGLAITGNATRRHSGSSVTRLSSSKQHFGRELAEECGYKVGEILCPCRDYVNGMFQSRIACRDHLIIRGFMPNYTVWRVHGEALASSSIQNKNENDNEPGVAGADEECVFGPNVHAQGVRVEPTFDPLFLETGVPLVPFQEPRGVPAKEVLRESAQSPKPFDTHTLRSKLSSYDLKLLRERCEIPPIVKLRLPEEDEYANMATIDEIGVYWDIRRPKAEANLFPHPPSSNHNWKERFLFVKLPKSQRREVCNEWLAECDTRMCNKLKEKDLSETDLEHIEKLKGDESLESRYTLSNAQLRECGIIFYPEPQDFDEEEEEGENDPGKENMSSRAQGDPPLFNSQGVLGDIIPDELASIHGIEEEEMQDLDFDTLVSGPQAKEIPPQAEEFVLGLSTVDKSKEAPRKRKVSGRGGSRATPSSVRADVPHRPAWGISVEESVFKSPRTAWDWSRHAIIPMDRKTLSAYGVADTANGMVQLMSQIGAEKLIAADKVLDKEKKKVMVENNCRKEAEKKVDDLSKKRFRDSKRALVHGYNECKTDIQKDHPEFDLSLNEHKFAREIAADDAIRAEEAERRKGASSRAMASLSIGRSLGASGSTSRTVSRQQSLAETQIRETGMPEGATDQDE
ncbi:hypothetical protein RJ639_017262 [Escallonia herrerae]|uniref:Transposase-associated domain-containing protein n=1 Tax=Escallonia herrerae TaxID=1293975 RepID=A0AA89AKP9_9ASTE|nr:hypothetical protein RJ639_017262 [Escallonia herrerae]